MEAITLRYSFLFWTCDFAKVKQDLVYRNCFIVIYVCCIMDSRSSKGRGRGRGLPLPAQNTSRFDPPILVGPNSTPTYNLVQFSRGVIWDDDLMEHLMIIFEETYIRMNKGNLGGTHWNQVWKDFVATTGATCTIKQCQDKITNIKKKLKHELEGKKATKGVNSEWHLFDLANRIWGSTPKQSGIPSK